MIGVSCPILTLRRHSRKGSLCCWCRWRLQQQVKSPETQTDWTWSALQAAATLKNSRAASRKSDLTGTSSQGDEDEASGYTCRRFGRQQNQKWKRLHVQSAWICFALRYQAGKNTSLKKTELNFYISLPCELDPNNPSNWANHFIKSFIIHSDAAAQEHRRISSLWELGEEQQRPLSEWRWYRERRETPKNTGFNLKLLQRSVKGPLCKKSWSSSLIQTSLNKNTLELKVGSLFIQKCWVSYCEYLIY